jgi:hypothetical protein
MWKFPNDRARANGLSFRPLNETIVDTAAWYHTLPNDLQKDSLLAFSENAKSLEDAMNLEMKLLSSWRRQNDQR